jgi:hypothetical protein
MVLLVGLAIILTSWLAIRLPTTRARRNRNLRWVVGPLLSVGFALNWGFVLIGYGVQENCGPHCIERSDVNIALALFVVVAGSWLLGLAVHFGRRRSTRRSRFERVESPWP